MEILITRHKNKTTIRVDGVVRDVFRMDGFWHVSERTEWGGRIVSEGHGTRTEAEEKAYTLAMEA